MTLMRDDDNATLPTNGQDNCWNLTVCVINGRANLTLSIPEFFYTGNHEKYDGGGSISIDLNDVINDDIEAFNTYDTISHNDLSNVIGLANIFKSLAHRYDSLAIDLNAKAAINPTYLISNL